MGSGFPSARSPAIFEKVERLGNEARLLLLKTTTPCTA